YDLVTGVQTCALPISVQHSLQLQKGKQTDLRKSGEVSVWLISDRRMALLHRKFLGQSGPTDVLTFQHGEIFISVDTAQRHARALDRKSVVKGKREGVR